jgi:hypothetical protein
VRKPSKSSEMTVDVSCDLSSSLHQDVWLSWWCGFRKRGWLMELKLGFAWEYWLSSGSCTVRQAQGFPEIGVSKEITKLVKLDKEKKDYMWIRGLESDIDQTFHQR